MKKCNSNYVILACLLAFLFAMPADAKRLSAKRPDCRSLIERIHGWEAAVTVLNLTPEQVQQIKQIKESAEEQAQEIVKEIKENTKQLKDELDKPEPDPVIIGELTMTIYELKNNLRQLREQTHDNLLNILTDEQREKLEQIQETALIMRAIPALHKIGFLAPQELPDPEPKPEREPEL